MERDYSLVRLNAIKHHYSFLKSRIHAWTGMDWDMVKNELLELGNNQFDMYTGTLTVEEIRGEAEDFLCKNQICSRADLHSWLGKTAYKTFILSDQSKWIFRESDSTRTPAHIHPARNQKMVRRMKSSHVKTAIAILVENKGNPFMIFEPNTLQINAIRTEKNGLSPVRSMEESKRILETLRFLSEIPIGNRVSRHS